MVNLQLSCHRYSAPSWPELALRTCLTAWFVANKQIWVSKEQHYTCELRRDKMLDAHANANATTWMHICYIDSPIHIDMIRSQSHNPWVTYARQNAIPLLICVTAIHTMCDVVCFASGLITGVIHTRKRISPSICLPQIQYKNSIAVDETHITRPTWPWVVYSFRKRVFPPLFNPST